MKDKHSRTFLKTMSWRVIATTTTMVLVFLFTGSLTLSLGLGAVEVVTKMMFYYLHERAWNSVAWGKHSI